MRMIKPIVGTLAAVALAFSPVLSASAHGVGHARGAGYGHGWGLGLVGAVAALVTLPIAVVSRRLPRRHRL